MQKRLKKLKRLKRLKRLKGRKRLKRLKAKFFISDNIFACRQRRLPLFFIYRKIKITQGVVTNYA